MIEMNECAKYTTWYLQKKKIEKKNCACLEKYLKLVYKMLCFSLKRTSFLFDLYIHCTLSFYSLVQSKYTHLSPYLFYGPLENTSLTWWRHHCRYSGNFLISAMLDTLVPWLGKGFCRASPTVGLAVLRLHPKIVASYNN